jgi:chorismate dehydratase
VAGVPTELNARLLSGDIDLTLISSIEFLRHRRELRALPDFSISTLGPVTSVMLFHWRPLPELSGARIAVTTDSATSVDLLRLLLSADGIDAEFVPMPPDLDAMMTRCDAALLIGDAALREAVMHRELAGRRPLLTDLGEAWYRQTRLPFTFAVWASRSDNPPSARLVAELRRAREAGLGALADVAALEATKLGLSQSVVQRYLGNFRYHFEPPDRDGLAAFGALALPDFDPGELSYWEL